MTLDPLDPLSDPGIPGYRLTAVYESAHTKTKVLAADSLPREAESGLADDLKPMDFSVLLFALPALFGLTALAVGVLAYLFLPAAAAVSLGLVMGAGVCLVAAVFNREIEREHEQRLQQRAHVFAEHRPHLVRISPARPARVAARAEERLGHLAYEASHRHHEARAAVAGDPVLTTHLPDIPDIARDALDTYRDRAWPPAEETEEREQIESILADSRERDDDTALRRLRARQVEFADRVRERGRAEQSAYDMLRRADDQVRHVLSRVRARDHLARKEEDTARLPS